MGYVLRYRWNNGTTLRYRTIQQVTTDAGIQKTTCVARLVAKAVSDDGTAALEQVIESVESTAGGVENLSALIGKPITIVTSPTGAITTIDGLEELAAELGLPPSFVDDFENTTRNTLAMFPDHPLLLGETWEAENTISTSIFSLSMATSSTLKSVHIKGFDRYATIAMRLRIKPAPDTDETGAVPGTPDKERANGGSETPIVEFGDGAGCGEVIFDLVDGRLLRSSLRARTALTMSGTETNVENIVSVQLLV